jgi:hypothetical protein
MMTEKQEQELRDEATVQKLLNTKNGKVFIEWLKRKTLFDRSIYEQKDGKMDYDPTRANLREGARQTVILITNAKDKPND